MDFVHPGGAQATHRKAKRSFALDSDGTDPPGPHALKEPVRGKTSLQSRRRRNWNSSAFRRSCLDTVIKTIVYVFNPAVLSLAILLALAASNCLLVLKGGGWDSMGNDAGSFVVIAGLKAMLVPTQSNQSVITYARKFPLISEGTYNYISDKILFACGGFVCAYTWILVAILKKYLQAETKLFGHYLGRVSRLGTADPQKGAEGPSCPQPAEKVRNMAPREVPGEQSGRVASSADKDDDRSKSMDDEVRAYAYWFEHLMESHGYARRVAIMLLPIVGLAFFATTVFDLSYGYLFHAFCAVQFFLGWYFFGITWNQADWAGLVLTINCARIDCWSVDITKARALILKKGNESLNAKSPALPPPPVWEAPPLESQESVHGLMWKEEMDKHVQPGQEQHQQEQPPAYETTASRQDPMPTAPPLLTPVNGTNLPSGRSIDLVGTIMQRFDSYSDLKGKLTTRDVWYLTKEAFDYPPEYSSFTSSSLSASDFSDPDLNATGSEGTWQDVDLESNDTEGDGRSIASVVCQRSTETMIPAIQSSVVKRKKTVYYLRKCINVLIVLSCPAVGWLVGVVYMIYSTDQAMAPSRVWDIVSLFQYSNVFLMLSFGSTMNWELHHRVKLIKILIRSKRNELEYERLVKLSGCN